MISTAAPPAASIESSRLPFMAVTTASWLARRTSCCPTLRIQDPHTRPASAAAEPVETDHLSFLWVKGKLAPIIITHYCHVHFSVMHKPLSTPLMTTGELPLMWNPRPPVGVGHNLTVSDVLERTVRWRGGGAERSTEVSKVERLRWAWPNVDVR